MKHLLLSVVLVVLFFSGIAQDGPAIPLSVVMPGENDVEGLSAAQLNRLQLRITGLVTENGLSADGSTEGFVIYPVFQVYNWGEARTTVNLQIAYCNFSLFIKRVVRGASSNIIFSSYTRQLEGGGMSRDEAVSNAIQQIRPAEAKLQTFFAEARNKIIDYYEKNCTSITKEATNASLIENYGKAFSLLLSIPVEAKSCHESVQQKLVEIYLKKQKKDCGRFIADARTFAANKQYDSALVALRKVDPESVCKEDLWNTINDIEGRVDADQKAKWEFLKSAYKDQVELEKARISSANEWAKTWMKGRGTRQYRIERSGGSNMVVTEEDGPGDFDEPDTKGDDQFRSASYPGPRTDNKPVTDSRNTTTVNLLESTDFKPNILFENNIFPSFIISRASVSNNETVRNYGDVNSCIGISVYNENAGGSLQYEIEPVEDKYFTSVRGVITFARGQKKLWFPEIPWKFDALRNIKQSTQVSVKFKLYDKKGKGKEIVKKISFRSIGECITWFTFDGKNEHTQLLAAYVNEENPQIDKLLKEGIEKKWVNGWMGYQGGKEALYQQVLAIWKIISSKGVKYSDISQSISNVSNTFFSQPVRSFCESIYNKQANCVEGTLVFASMLQKIGIRPVLVLVPGHCFLAYHTSERDTDDYEYLETTMIGDYTGKPNDETLDANFRKALESARKKKETTSKADLYFIEVQTARQQNIRPINLSDESCR